MHGYETNQIQNQNKRIRIKVAKKKQEIEDRDIFGCRNNMHCIKFYLN